MLQHEVRKSRCYMACAQWRWSTLRAYSYTLRFGTKRHAIAATEQVGDSFNALYLLDKIPPCPTSLKTYVPTTLIRAHELHLLPQSVARHLHSFFLVPGLSSSSEEDLVCRAYIYIYLCVCVCVCVCVFVFWLSVCVRGYRRGNLTIAF